MPALFTVAGRLQGERAARVLIDLAGGSVRSSALRNTAALALGGAAFALGNLLLARVLPQTEFGKVSLMLALIQVGGALGAPGIPLLINRHRWRPTPKLLGASALCAAAAAIVTACIAQSFYAVAFALAALLGGAVAMAALGRVAGAFFQSRERFRMSLLLTQSHNWLLLASAPLVLLLGSPHASTVAAVLVAGYVVVTALGLRGAIVASRETPVSPVRQRWFAEALSAAALMVAGNLLFQLDRLLIGGLLTLHDLAAYSVVAAVAGSAFRMLQVGAGYSLAPRLRGCKRRADAMQVLVKEGAVLGAMALLIAALLLLLTPWLRDDVLEGRYEFSATLVFVIISVGFVRILEAMASAVVSALGSTRELSLLSVLGWSAAGLSTACAVWAHGFGLLGVVCALGFGWCFFAFGASVLAARAWSRLP